MLSFAKKMLEKLLILAFSFPLNINSCTGRLFSNKACCWGNMALARVVHTLSILFLSSKEVTIRFSLNLNGKRFFFFSSADFSDCRSVCTEKRNVKKCSACKMVSMLCIQPKFPEISV